MLSQLSQIKKVKVKKILLNKDHEDFSNESILLENTRSSARLRKIPVIRDETGRIIEALCFIKQPDKILEIGCGTGYSTYFLLKNFIKKNFFSKKQSRNCCYTGIDLNKTRIEEAQNFIDEIYPELKNPESVKISFINGNALKILPKIDDRFDLIFIDAAKFEYLLYIKALEGKLERDSIIITDNIFYSNKIFEEKINNHDKNSVQGIKEYMDYVTHNKNFETVFINIGDGIALSIYKGV